MRTSEVDERDSDSDVSDPVFRVYFFEGDRRTESFGVSCFDVADADVAQVLEWADASAVGRSFALALVRRVPGLPNRATELTWLLGTDLNAPGAAVTPAGKAMFARAQT